jgi:DNA-binding LacI/PurR family transcriptional regulator
VVKPNARPAVMHDVARLAGVSHQTVSRVLNDHPNVRPETRERVRLAIRQLNYRPNKLAKGLVTRRSGRVGVVTLGSRLYGPTSTLMGIEHAARSSGYTVTIAVAESGAAQLTAAVAGMLEQSVEGILVIAPDASGARTVASLSVDVPVVAVEAGHPDAVPVASVDQHEGARIATEHLLSLGHRTVWHVAGPEDWLEARERAEGWRYALSLAGAPAPPVLRGDWTAASGHRLAGQLADRADATAVFVANDQMALGLLNGLQAAGVRVPRDLSVVGFDDTPDSAFFIPPLTTVRQDFDAVGRLGVRLLAEMILGAERPVSERITPDLVVRSSTAAPART